MNGRRRDRRRLAGASVAILAMAMLLVACGGDGGGGGGGGQGAVKLHALIVNASPDDVTIGYLGDGTAADDQVVPTCTAALIDFDLADPFQLTVDGTPAIDTEVDLPGGLPNDGESALVLQVNITKDGTVTLGEDPNHLGAENALKPGRGYSTPSTASFCPTLPG